MDHADSTKLPVVVIGGGFGGLSAAWDLACSGVPVVVLEGDSDVGGLAGGYDVDGNTLEKFYHHWFTSDLHIQALIDELGLSDRVVLHESRTGLYYANTLFRLSKPLDVLRFSPLSFAGRIRLGLMALRARRVRDWKKLESVSAQNWLIRLGGEEVYRVVWEPLLKGKFGPFAERISAVWFWNKIALRGSSRGKGGKEMLAYFRGGFLQLANSLAEAIRQKGGEVLLNTSVLSIDTVDGRVVGVTTDKGAIACRTVIATPALPQIADLLAESAPQDYVASLRRIQYLANVCLVLQLDRSLSETYWLNVNDGSFPYVGIIEHTNFEDPAAYGGRHIVYLSKYLTSDEQLYRMSDDEVLNFSLPHIQRMFPAFDRSWILEFNVWRADYAQPIVELHYSSMIPATSSPIEGLYIASMAQIYPEDRGTNYAVREGRKLGQLIASHQSGGSAQSNSSAAGRV